MLHHVDDQPIDKSQQEADVGLIVGLLVLRRVTVGFSTNDKGSAGMRGKGDCIDLVADPTAVHGLC
jgi:hypothetical protein